MNNPLYERYKPRICADLMAIKGNGLQLGLYMSLIYDIKPLLDDWIQSDKISEFKKTCKKYGVFVREDVLFENVHKNDVPARVLGRECLTTTSAYGHPLSSGFRGEVHVFLSKDRRVLRQAMWYPVIIHDRVVFGPRIDHLKYGRVLGYPDCCIRFFRQYNDWIKYSHLYEAMKHTNGKPSFACNPLLKDTIFSYIYHMPCCYNCRSTISLVRKLRSRIRKDEPAYVRLTDKYLKKPFLVFYERKFYMFDGIIRNNILKYRKVCFVSRDPAGNLYEEDLKHADALTLKGRDLILTKKGKWLKTIPVPASSFAPESPFLIQYV